MLHFSNLLPKFFKTVSVWTNSEFCIKKCLSSSLLLTPGLETESLGKGKKGETEPFWLDVPAEPGPMRGALHLAGLGRRGPWKSRGVGGVALRARAGGGGGR